MRLGYETSAWNGLSLQADFDQIWLMAGNYNSSRNGKTSYPVIADPAMTALNRLQLTYASDYDTKLARARSSRCRARRFCAELPAAADRSRPRATLTLARPIGPWHSNRPRRGRFEWCGQERCHKSGNSKTYDKVRR